MSFIEIIRAVNVADITEPTELVGAKEEVVGPISSDLILAYGLWTYWIKEADKLPPAHYCSQGQTSEGHSIIDMRRIYHDMFVAGCYVEYPKLKRVQAFGVRKGFVLVSYKKDDAMRRVILGHVDLSKLP